MPMPNMRNALGHSLFSPFNLTLLLLSKGNVHSNWSEVLIPLLCDHFTKFHSS